MEHDIEIYKFKAYELKDRLKILLNLLDWEIRLIFKFSVEDAQVATDNRYKRAEITLPEGLDDHTLRVRMVHEFLHILFAGMSHAILRGLGSESPHYEYHTDGEEHAIKSLESIILHNMRIEDSAMSEIVKQD